MTPDLRLGDCLDAMATIPDGSIDLILCDLPYGTTACKWDTPIPFEPLWDAYRRILKPRGGAVVLTACQPFTSKLVMSNPEWFRYEWIWDKVGLTGFLDANRRPLRRHENILVFAPQAPPYRPVMGTGDAYRFKGGTKSAVYGAYVPTPSDNAGTRYPTTVLRISNANWRERGKRHPTQKPVPLMEYLVRTYTGPGDLVLDNCMGSGTTGVACANSDRRFIGVERDPGYFAFAEKRIADAHTSLLAESA